MICSGFGAVKAYLCHMKAAIREKTSKNNKETMFIVNVKYLNSIVDTWFH